MWLRGAAIRPVPEDAVVSRGVLDRIESSLADGGVETKSELDDAFERFEETQPALAQRAADILAQPLDETALALGYFLTIAVWLAFEKAFGPRLSEVTEEAREAAEASIALEEELRAQNTQEPLELEDVMALEQPHLVAFIHEHLEAALELDDGEPRVDIDDVHLVYRSVLVQTLALSHAVRSTRGSVSRELLA
jgi:hypothetical protein